MAGLQPFRAVLETPEPPDEPDTGFERDWSTPIAGARLTRAIWVEMCRDTGSTNRIRMSSCTVNAIDHSCAQLSMEL